MSAGVASTRTTVLSVNSEKTEHGFIRLNPRTHDISLSDCHISSIEALAADLDIAAQAACARRSRIRYDYVYCLLITWKDDDLGVLAETLRLQQLLKNRYRFHTDTYGIPIKKPGTELSRRMLDFLDFDGQEVLFIVHYAGNARRGQQPSDPALWFPNQMNRDITISSANIQSTLEEANADVLLLFDCCHSAAVPTLGPSSWNTGVKEVIAACGFENQAPEVGEHSFTAALTEVLAFTSLGTPFSVGELHRRVLSRIKCHPATLQRDEEGDLIENAQGALLLQHRSSRTPIYSLICETDPRRSIVIAPLLAEESKSAPFDCSTPSSLNTHPTSRNPGSSSQRRQDGSLDVDPVEELIPGIFPQILISVRLEKERFDQSQWLEWIRNLPLEGKDIHVEGKWGSFSNLVLLRIPIPVWNLLPDNPAYTFVGFVTTPNKLLNLEEGVVNPAEQDLRSPSDNLNDSLFSDEMAFGDPLTYSGRPKWIMSTYNLPPPRNYLTSELFQGFAASGTTIGVASAESSGRSSLDSGASNTASPTTVLTKFPWRSKNTEESFISFVEPSSKTSETGRSGLAPDTKNPVFDLPTKLKRKKSRPRVAHQNWTCCNCNELAEMSTYSGLSCHNSNCMHARCSNCIVEKYLPM